MTCHIAADDRECMLRHSHARHHRDSGPCLSCSTGISRMSRAVEWPPATAEVAPNQPKRRGRPRKTPAVPAPAAAPAPVPAPVAPGQPKRRGRPRKAPAVPAPATIPAPAPARVTIDAVRQAVRDALPMAEACALGAFVPGPVSGSTISARKWSSLMCRPARSRHSPATPVISLRP